MSADAMNRTMVQVARSSRAGVPPSAWADELLFRSGCLVKRVFDLLCGADGIGTHSHLSLRPGEDGFFRGFPHLVGFRPGGCWGARTA